MSIFQRYAGGTELGNFFRSVGQKISPALGNGGAMITQQQEDLRDLPEDLYIKKYGKNKYGQTIPSVVVDSGISSPARQIIEAEKQNSKRGKIETAKRMFKEYWYFLVLPVSLVIGYKIFKKLFSKQSTRKKGW